VGNAHQNPDMVGIAHPTYISKIKYESYSIFKSEGKQASALLNLKEARRKEI
jgi:hypothetical protein